MSRELRWLESENQARFELHTPENASAQCTPNCYGHYVWDFVWQPGPPTIIRSLEDGE